MEIDKIDMHPSQGLEEAQTEKALSQITGADRGKVLTAGGFATTVTALTGGIIGASVKRAGSSPEKRTATGLAIGASLGIAGTGAALVATRGRARVTPVGS